MNSKITLAVYISTIRENLGLSQKGLAVKANVDLTVIEAVEAGQDLFLATSIRQKIAKALKIESRQLRELEREPRVIKDIPEDIIEELKLRILEGHLEANACPNCGSELICRVAEMFNLEDNLVRHPKARCSKCPFQIR